jgi:hypothetical protein
VLFEAGRIAAEIIDLASERAKRARPETMRTEATDQAAGQGRGGADRPRRSAEEVLAAITGRQAAFTWRDLNRQLGKEIADPTLAALATDELLRHRDVIGLRETADAPVSSSCQGWPSHQPFHALCACQAIP